MINENEKEQDELGLTKRSHHADGKIPGGTLGALLCSHAIFKDFKIGTGFTEAERQGIWDRKDFLLNFQVKFKYQPHGTQERPRIPVFIGWRHPND
jgi:DNA ligase-1